MLHASTQFVFRVYYILLVKSYFIQINHIHLRVNQKKRNNKDMTQQPDMDKFTGCMAASAVGGALGNEDGTITDDTQMALFTAEGLILSKIRSEYQDKEDVIEPVFHSLLRWLYTQQVFMMGDLIKSYGTCSIVDGILMGHQELFSLRDPSGTCLKTLSDGKMGTLAYPPNHVQGPGALVRTLPVGLAFSDPEKAFDTGCKTAAITHGHPDAILSSGVLAALISQILSSQPLPWALNAIMALLKSKPDHDPVFKIIGQAITLSSNGTPEPEVIDEHFNKKTAVHTLGAGLYSALCHPSDFKRGILLAVSHSGNCDETGALTGGILGALNGINTIPNQFLNDLELKDVILEMAIDIFEQFHKHLI